MSNVNCKEKTAVIKSIKNSFATVVLEREQSCEGCKGCVLAVRNITRLAYLEEGVKCETGYKVRLTMPEKQIPLAVMWLYVIPLVGLFIGLFIGMFIGILLDLNSELLAAIFASVFCVIAVVPVGMVDMTYRRRKEFLPVVTGVVQHGKSA